MYIVWAPTIALIFFDTHWEACFFYCKDDEGRLLGYPYDDETPYPKFLEF